MNIFSANVIKPGRFPYAKTVSSSVNPGSPFRGS